MNASYTFRHVMGRPFWHLLSLMHADVICLVYDSMRPLPAEN